MTTLKQIRQKADAKLADFWSVLTTKQDAYFAKHGRYFQLLISPDTSVIDGVDSSFTKRTPTDERFVVDVDFPWTDKIPFQIEVHEWVGNGDDKGYKAIVWVELADGRIFTRNRDSNQNDSGWYEYIELQT